MESAKDIATMRTSTIIITLLALLTFTGCRVKSGPEAKTTVGRDYQVVVICDNDAWSGDLSTAVCDLLEEDIPGLVRPESQFDIVKQVSSQEATDADKRHGILFVIKLTPSNDAPSYKLTSDIYAHPQLIITLTASNVEQAVEYIESHTAELREIMMASEREEALKSAKGKPAKQLMADFKENTGYTMLIPANFSKANPADKSITWYIRDYKNKAQYIFAFKTDYNPDASIATESSEIVNAINAKFNTISSKDVNGSYMQIDQYRPVAADLIEVNGQAMLELRGCWEVAHDYMGGSFTAYTIFDPTTSSATIIVYALYAPEDAHRNLMREMEALIYTLER
jgi:hypothetical protein